MYYNYIFRRKYIFLVLFIYFETEFNPCHPGWSAMMQSGLTTLSTFRVQVIFLPQSPE